jgi:hypothetical protein
VERRTSRGLTASHPFFAREFLAAALARTAFFAGLGGLVLYGLGDATFVALGLATFALSIVERVVERSPWAASHPRLAIWITFWVDLGILVFAREQAIYFAGVIDTGRVSGGFEAIALEASRLIAISRDGVAVFATGVVYVATAIAFSALATPARLAPSGRMEAIDRVVTVVAFLSVFSGAGAVLASLFVIVSRFGDTVDLALKVCAVGVYSVIFSALGGIMIFLPLRLLDRILRAISGRILRRGS